jgi:hypothetical protein
MASRSRLQLCHQLEIAGLRDVFSVCRTCVSSRGMNWDCKLGGVGPRKGFVSRTSPSTRVLN